jgi:hypothetical protein
LFVDRRLAPREYDYQKKGKGVGSKAMIEKPRSEWIIIPDKHPAIVSQEIFEQVQLKVSTADVEDAVMAIIKKQAEVVLNCADLSGLRKTTVNNNQFDGSVVQLNSVEQAARRQEADNKTAALAKNALSETAEPKDIVDALIEKVFIFPNNHIEIHWKFENFAEAV